MKDDKKNWKLEKIILDLCEVFDLRPSESREIMTMVQDIVRKKENKDEKTKT